MEICGLTRMTPPKTFPPHWTQSGISWISLEEHLHLMREAKQDADEIITHWKQKAMNYESALKSELEKSAELRKEKE